MQTGLTGSTATLLLRADAGPDIGAGHVMRCLALASAALNRGWRCIIFTRGGKELIRDRCADERLIVLGADAPLGSLMDARSTATLAADRSVDWIVVDGYGIAKDPSGANPSTQPRGIGFEDGYLETLRSGPARVLLLDDYGHHDRYDADCILNQNITAWAGIYAERSPSASLLLGPRYILLRPEFTAYNQRVSHSTSTPMPRIVVSMGGADLDNATGKALDALALLSPRPASVDVILGKLNPHVSAIEKRVRELSDAFRSPSLSEPIRLHYNVEDMTPLLSQADLAVIAGGSTCWETLFLGAPSLALIVADNQAEISETLDALDLLRCPGWADKIASNELADKLASLLDHPNLLEAMSRRGRDLVDGHGASLVMDHLQKQASFEAAPHLRAVCLADVVQLWHLANDHTVRACGFAPESIPLADHERWFHDWLTADDKQMWVVEDGGAVIGQVRYHRTSEEAAEISISLCSDYRGRGLGPWIIRETLVSAAEQLRVGRIEAVIRTDNFPSARAFEKAGFVASGSGTRNGVSHHVYTWSAAETDAVAEDRE